MTRISWLVGAALLSSALLAPSLTVAQEMPGHDMSGHEMGATSNPLGSEDKSCKLQSPAFCDTFDEPSPYTSRTGQLNPSRWSVSRVNTGVNTNQGEINTWAATLAMHCRTPIEGVQAPQDYFMCGPEFGESNHFMEAIDDDSHYLYNDARILQPFDFTGRTGTIAFDVDAKTSGSHGWWLEVWIVSEPVPGPHADQGHIENVKDGIGVYFIDPCGLPVPAGDAGSGQVGISRVDVVRNFSMQSTKVNKNTCTATSPDMLNHFEIKLSQNRLEVWGSDHMKQNFQLLSVAEGFDLPFSVGYVNFEDSHYDAKKAGDGVATMQTYHWDNLGFDGPVLPTPRMFSVPDALTRKDSSHVNLGYLLSSGGLEKGPLKIAGVDLSGANSAMLTFNAYGERSINYRLNGGAWHNYTLNSGGNWSAAALPVDLAELQNGDNSLEFQSEGGGRHVVGNIDLLVN